MTGDSRGLEASIWASRTRSHEPYRFDTRSRSVPPPASTSTPSSSAAPPTTSAATSTVTSASSATLTPAQAFHRFQQACQRLRWKFVDLENSYKRAMSPADWAFTEDDAERNFKVDFHEFYMWIEQALVLLLLVWGVEVPREKPSHEGGRTRGAAAHAYHHNVLMALDKERNPLYGVLGQGHVNHALWKAKELRNRWKDAAEGRETPPLKMYDLTWIVTQILRGLEVAYGIAAVWVDEKGGAVDAGVKEDVGDKEEGWDWMVEPMDWES